MDFDARVVGRKRIREDQWVGLNRAQLRGEDFSGRKLEKFSAVGCRFESCRFDRVRIDDASFGAGREQSEYVDCSFDRARMRLLAGGYARFVRCSFRDVDLRDWFCFRVELVDCTFSGRLRGAIFNGTVPEEDREYAGRERNEFRGNDFSGMELIDVAFRTGIDLSLQRLPSEPAYLYLPDAASVVRRARAEALGWQDLELRRGVLTFLGVLADDVAKGQRQLLLRPANYYGYKALRRNELDAVFKTLRAFNDLPEGSPAE